MDCAGESEGGPGGAPVADPEFVDQEAEFIFVPAREVRAKAAELGATAFDIEGCELGQHG